MRYKKFHGIHMVRRGVSTRRNSLESPFQTPKTNSKPNRILLQRWFSLWTYQPLNMKLKFELWGSIKAMATTVTTESSYIAMRLKVNECYEQNENKTNN